MANSQFSHNYDHVKQVYVHGSKRQLTNQEINFFVVKVMRHTVTIINLMDISVQS